MPRAESAEEALLAGGAKKKKKKSSGGSARRASAPAVAHSKTRKMDAIEFFAYKVLAKNLPIRESRKTSSAKVGTAKRGELLIAEKHAGKVRVRCDSGWFSTETKTGQPTVQGLSKKQYTALLAPSSSSEEDSSGEYSSESEDAIVPVVLAVPAKVYGEHGGRPSDRVTCGIVTALLCPYLCSVPALYFECQVQDTYTSGNTQGAWDYSRKAKQWRLASNLTCLIGYPSLGIWLGYLGHLSINL
jgi:hypothetical protein